MPRFAIYYPDEDIIYSTDLGRKAAAVAAGMLKGTRKITAPWGDVLPRPEYLEIIDYLAGHSMTVVPRGSKGIYLQHRVHDMAEEIMVGEGVFSSKDFALLDRLKQGEAGLPKERVTQLVQKRDALTERGYRDLKNAFVSLGYEVSR